MILSDKLKIMCDDYCNDDSNVELINNILSVIPNDLLLNINNLLLIENEIFNKYNKIPAYCMVYGVAINHNNVDDYMCKFKHDYFDKVSKILGKKCNIEDSETLDYFTYALLLKVSKSYYGNLSKHKFDDIINNLTSIKSAINALIRCEYIDLESTATIGYLTYYFMMKDMFSGVVSDNNTSSFIKCNTALSHLIADVAAEVASEIELESFESMLNIKPEYHILNINDIDWMTGPEFEKAICSLFDNMGYKTHLTKASGDQGVDVIAEKSGIKIGIQAKCYSSSVSNSAVQEIVAGIKHYGIERGFVITNNYFTNSAKELAKSNNIILWDRDYLNNKLNELLIVLQ